MLDSRENKRSVEASNFVRLRFQTLFKKQELRSLLARDTSILTSLRIRNSRQAGLNLFCFLAFLCRAHTPRFLPWTSLNSQGLLFPPQPTLRSTLTVAVSDPQHCLPCRPLLSVHTIKYGPPQPLAPDAIQHLSLGIRAVHRRWSRYGCEAWHE